MDLPKFKLQYLFGFSAAKWKCITSFWMPIAKVVLLDIFGMNIAEVVLLCILLLRGLVRHDFLLCSNIVGTPLPRLDPGLCPVL